MNIAIVGATGKVGRKLIEVLEKKNFPVTEAHLVASPNSAGKKIHFLGNISVFQIKASSLRYYHSFWFESNKECFSYL